jgi:hypothetical protein
MKAAWGLHSSHGYGLFEVKMPSEKMCWMRSFRGAECVVRVRRPGFMRKMIHIVSLQLSPANRDRKLR